MKELVVLLARVAALIAENGETISKYRVENIRVKHIDGIPLIAFNIGTEELEVSQNENLYRREIKSVDYRYMED